MKHRNSFLTHSRVLESENTELKLSLHSRTALNGMLLSAETTDNWNDSSDQRRKLLMLRKRKSIIQGQADLILTWWWRRTVRGVGSSGGPPLQPPVCKLLPGNKIHSCWPPGCSVLPLDTSRDQTPVCYSSPTGSARGNRGFH